ncbi:DNA-directed RNA polymerase I subunit RPA1 [Pyrenophora tritici-repentis Pt-1C-BFP]|uniref:DNA-directed RNA polymerase subunit n=3 Tax=Pyrenophora tritici-repentis TaxID=45151 RepID=A0A922T338_9PLEO|nr:DNA-directed RNA polymerase I subunit RPA1 [Pyrenophora tritici-repentis Pt-1C-BFP]EDU41334.1 DNA-directed RNA polymerase I subunit RPA1 [Pyrenophora tritici-repentis Pt-1C-BFP]KAI1518112.1 DNA-directed RNA polymerase [Pyrenophora tritici-repentis]
MNTHQPTSSAINGVEFGFLTTKDIKALSVKRISIPTTFDSINHPVPGGLHDPALGAFLDNPCATCGLTTFLGCPGHCGHIELPVPVYHLTFMDQLLRLLRGTCAYCHHTKLARTTINEFVSKLRLIRCGLVQEANDMHLHITHGKGKTNDLDAPESDDEDDDDNDDIITQRNNYVKRCMKYAGISKHEARTAREKNETISDARRQVVKDFYAELVKHKSCRNCQGISPSYRKDRGIKIFRKALSQKDKAKMAQAEKRIQSPLDILARREAKAKKQHVHADEGVADLDPVSEEDEDMDIDMQQADGSLVATESRMARRTKPATEESENAQEYVSAAEVKATMTLLFENESEMMRMLYSPYGSKSLVDVSPDMFFTQAIIVPPNKYRPEDGTGETITESPKNKPYKSIIEACETINQISHEMRGRPNETGYRQRNFDDMQTQFVNLQGVVNALIDCDANPVQGRAGAVNTDGIKQALEKKEGLFRKNMMGKRVNFAARSVISPDPNIETNEIGVPPVFAKKLTYPEPVTNHNFYDLKEAVLNGPDKWPGAHAIENEFGQIIALRKKTYDERLALANQLLAPTNSYSNGARNKKVHRHLNNGDVVIMNRQPTLHKPSMMAHRARVLPGEKTIRMHYANCNTYNADFDGDEMNMHFPQNELARAEAMTIADTDHQYLSATAGKPLRGLIQDHISMGVSISNKDTFFTREEYHQLLYSSLRPEEGHTTSGRLETVSPAVLKPRPMWTGKQIITTILKNIKPAEYQGLTLTSKSSTNGKLWGVHSEEQIVIVKDGHLLSGIMDKGQIGPAAGGLINGIYEAYGETIAGRALSIIGRLLTKMLHMRAFSCGVEDLILTEEGDRARLEELRKAEKLGFEIASKYVTLDAEKIDPTNPELRRRLEAVLRDDTKQHGLDLLTNTANSKISSAVTAAVLPDKLIKKFPKNQMQAMTGSGAKGSMVNANQISCNLGQQVLEGRRVPVMISGKTLPCFKPFETSVRAGGYIVNRFLTGIRPQEYYFHMMAGREGLIDTAVKTSRSGYLQRCIIKGMEGLRVEYDTSVRDADGTMVQFLYGEDGLDTTKQKYLNDFKFQAQNFYSLAQTLHTAEAYPRVASAEAVEHNKKAAKKARKGDVTSMDPATAVYTPSRHSGSTSELFLQAKREYCDTNPDKLLKLKKQDPEGEILKRTFEQMLDLKYLRSLVEPGEAVGVVAGQSIGEPSTQMTLNTFHLAGHSAKNVTLGIPRLREIVMTASANISTPSMQLYPHPELSKEECEKFAKSITRLPLSAVLDKVTVTETFGTGTHYSQARSYKIRLDFYPMNEYTKEYAIKVRDVAESIEKKFCPRLHKEIRKDLKKKGENKSLSTANSASVPNIGQTAGRSGEQTVDEDEDSFPAGLEGGSADEDSDDGEGDNDTTQAKARNRRGDSVSYEEPEEEEQAATAELDKEDQISEDETYGGSPKPSRATSPNTDADDDDEDEDDDEQMVDPTNEPSEIRHERICKDNADIFGFKFDDRKGAFCEITFEFSAAKPKLLMLHHVEEAANFATIHVIPGITAAQFSAKSKDVPENVINTEGSNLIAMREYGHIIDVNRTLTNDIAAMLRIYGVEAGRATIVREMHNVFSGHGISVDHRHLNLIADTMTKGGGFTPFSRIGLKGNVSPFMKMSFETTVGFLKDAVLERDWDELKNPSARIVVGRLGGIGTGAFDVLAPVKIRDPLKEQVEEVERVVVGDLGGKRDSDSESESEPEEEEEEEEGGDEDIQMQDVDMEDADAGAEEEPEPVQELPPPKKKKSKKHGR